MRPGTSRVICLMVSYSHKLLEGISVNGIICLEVAAYQFLELSQDVDGSYNGPVIQFTRNFLEYHILSLFAKPSVLQKFLAVLQRIIADPGNFIGLAVGLNRCRYNNAGDAIVGMLDEGDR